jgi:DNA polymerase III subunit alpha
MPAPFVHLHSHSYYSLLRGLASPAALARVAAESEMPALALTDRRVLTGAVEFSLACREAGVRPLLGLELVVGLPCDLPAEPTGPVPLVLLAMNQAGWANLCRLSSAANAGGLEQLPFESLVDGSGGLICLAGGNAGLLARLVREGRKRPLQGCLARLAELFPGRLYVELANHGPEEAELCAGLAEAAKESGLPVAAAQNIHYLSEEHPQHLPLSGPESIHSSETKSAPLPAPHLAPPSAPHLAPPSAPHLARLVAAIRLNCTLEEVPASELPPPGAYFTSAVEMERQFEAYPSALAATVEIAGRCRFELPLGAPHYPKYELPEGTGAGELLRQKAEAGAARLYGEASHGLRTRLSHELAEIDRAGYSDIFLVMEEIIQFARQAGIPYASRGSASSSLVAYCLEITTPDPIRLNLYFERFLNPARTTPPDIDTDLCSRRRDEVIRFVYRRWGAERVAMVCTINRFRRRSALREAAKAHGWRPAQISTLVEALPQRWWGPPGGPGQTGGPFDELSQRFSGSDHQELFRDAAALIGLPRHLSIHPGGVVIAPGRLTDLVSTQMAAKGVAITQFDLESIERLGLVKIDLLGIRGLTVLGDMAQPLGKVSATEAPWETAGDRETRLGAKPGEPGTGALGGDSLETGPGSQTGRPVRSPLEVLEAIPEDDPAVADALRAGRTIGCFQIESPGMRATLKEIQADSVDDLMAALALYRPGPLTGGLKAAFVRRFRGEEPVSHLHPALAPLLADTYGVILYQEQVLRIAHELAGLSLVDADLLRRAMSHFDPGRQMRSLQERFIVGAWQHSQIGPETAGRVWEMMAAFAGYGFPKAHAASYAVVAWRAAWCKTHYPALFMAAVLANWGGFYSQRVYLTEARRLGLDLRPPHVNYSGREFSAVALDSQPPGAQPALFMGLNQIRDLTRRTQARIVKERPFASLDDFLARADPRQVEAENLALAGALEGFGSQPALLRRLQAGGWRGGQLPLFELGSVRDEAGSAGQDWSKEQKAAAQEAVLGLSVDQHPLELVSQAISEAGALSTLEAAGRPGERVLTAGMRQAWRRGSSGPGRSGRSEPVYYMALEDLEGMLDVVISSEVYRRCQAALKGPGPYLIEGLVAIHQATGEPFIRAERVERL